MESTPKRAQETGKTSVPERKDMPSTGQSQPVTATTPNRQSTDEQTLMDQGTEIIEQAKQKVTDVYNQTAQSVTHGYENIKAYGQKNPGTMTLIAFGAGVGVGLLLANGMMNSRSTRAGRIVPPVLNALSDIASQVLR
ncbi:MAG: hypothetical protein AB1757_06615 [Acidobacteriota bacterium]